MKFDFSYKAIVLLLVFVVMGCSNNQSEEYGFASEDGYSSDGGFRDSRLTEGPMSASAMAPPPMVAPRVSRDSTAKSQSISSGQVVDKESRSGKMQMQPTVD
ncbi:uncharacterized protein METZ01_LOCUS412469, partial [marine metagenome]